MQLDAPVAFRGQGETLIDERGEMYRPVKKPVTTEGRAKAALEARVSFFDVRDVILRDGLSDLSLKNVEGLHLGFEEYSG